MEPRIKGCCGKNCARCNILGVCDGCHNLHCLVCDCHRLGINYTGITYPTQFCMFGPLCPENCSGNLIKKPKARKPSKIMKRNPQPRLDLPKFIPVIKLHDDSTWFWDNISHDALVVKFEDLVRNREILRKISSKGIHDFLGFHGKVVISTISPDELLDRFTGKAYAEMVNAIEPNTAMMLDCYTYIDHPLEISWNQLFKFFKNAVELFDSTDIPLMGIVKGANFHQINWCLEHLLKLGFTTLVVDYREPTHKGSYYRRSLDHMLTIIGNMTSDYEDVDIIIHGKRFLEEFVSHPNFHFVSLGWFLKARGGVAYRGRISESLERNMLYKCNCRFCNERTWNELVQDVKAVALHNLSESIASPEGAEEE